MIPVNSPTASSDPSDVETIRRWVETWRRAGPEMDKFKRAELRAMTDEEGTLRAIRVMNSRARHAREAARDRPVSGLIEQQRLFSKLHPSS